MWRQDLALGRDQVTRLMAIARTSGAVGDALDNALMESTIGLYKIELSDQRATEQDWSGRREAERKAADWSRWHTTERIHSLISYVTPCEHEATHAATPGRPDQEA